MVRWLPASFSAPAGPSIHRSASRMAPTKRVIASSLAKMPTTSVLAFMSFPKDHRPNRLRKKSVYWFQIWGMIDAA
jgi:hypothetical protein